jgi:predicted TIM-barrel fold metal-dependent hydrolase
MLDHMGEMVNNLLFASDYPHWDADAPDDSWPVAIPEEISRKIYHDNAAKLFGLD